MAKILTNVKTLLAFYSKQVLFTVSHEQPLEKYFFSRLGQKSADFERNRKL